MRYQQPQNGPTPLNPLWVEKGLYLAWCPTNGSDSALVAGKKGALGDRTITLSQAASDTAIKGTLITGLQRTFIGTSAYADWFSLRFVGTWSSNVELFQLGVGNSPGSTDESSYIAHDSGIGYGTSGGTPGLGLDQQHVLQYDTSTGTVATNHIVAGSSQGALSSFGSFPWNTGNIRAVHFGNAALGIYASYGLMFSTQLSASDLAILRANPWQVWAPATRKIWVASAGSSSDTPVNPGVGSLTITGYAPAIAQPIAVAPGVGSIAITGYAPTIAQPIAVAPGVGSLTITGYAPTVTISASHAVTPDVGSITITGYAPSIVQPRAVAPDVGSIALTGYAPTITQGIYTAVNPDVGTLAITGHAPSITQTQNQTIDPGVCVITVQGFAPTIVQTTSLLVTPGVGAVVITGHAPTVYVSGLLVSDLEYVAAIEARDFTVKASDIMPKFPNLDPEEKRILTFDFAADLATGETVNSATVEVISATDDTPTGHFGTPQVASPTVLIAAEGCTAGSYHLRVIAPTSNADKTLVIGATLPVIAQ